MAMGNINGTFAIAIYLLRRYKNVVRLILDNFGIVGFLFFDRIPVDSSHFSLHFDNILSPKAPKYFILNVLNFKAQFSPTILAYGPTGGQQKNVAY
jgi:hypothetical protein